MQDNALVEKPRRAPPLPSPAASNVPIPAKEEPQSIFDKAKKPAQRSGKEQLDYHDHQTHRFKISPRKLNRLARQIGGKPIDYAILQMTFSEKRAARRVTDLLIEARDDAQRIKRLQRTSSSRGLGNEGVDAQTSRHKRARDQRARENGYQRAQVQQDECEVKTPEEREEERRMKMLKRIAGPGFTREDVPLRNARPMWT